MSKPTFPCLCLLPLYKKEEQAQRFILSLGRAFQLKMEETETLVAFLKEEGYLSFPVQPIDTDEYFCVPAEKSCRNALTSSPLPYKTNILSPCRICKRSRYFKNAGFASEQILITLLLREPNRFMKIFPENMSGCFQSSFLFVELDGAVGKPRAQEIKIFQQIYKWVSEGVRNRELLFVIDSKNCETGLEKISLSFQNFLNRKSSVFSWAELKPVLLSLVNTWELESPETLTTEEYLAIGKKLLNPDAYIVENNLTYDASGSLYWPSPVPGLVLLSHRLSSAGSSPAETLPMDNVAAIRDRIKKAVPVLTNVTETVFPPQKAVIPTNGSDKKAGPVISFACGGEKSFASPLGSSSDVLKTPENPILETELTEPSAGQEKSILGSSEPSQMGVTDDIPCTIDETNPFDSSSVSTGIETPVDTSFETNGDSEVPPSVQTDANPFSSCSQPQEVMNAPYSGESISENPLTPRSMPFANGEDSFSGVDPFASANEDASPQNNSSSQRDTADGPTCEAPLPPSLYQCQSNLRYSDGALRIEEEMKKYLFIPVEQARIPDFLSHLMRHETWLALEYAGTGNNRGIAILGGSGVRSGFIHEKDLTPFAMKCLTASNKKIEVYTQSLPHLYYYMRSGGINNAEQITSLTSLFHQLEDNNSTFYPDLRLLSFLEEEKIPFKGSELVELMLNYRKIAMRLSERVTASGKIGRIRMAAFSWYEILLGTMKQQSRVPAAYWYPLPINESETLSPSVDSSYLTVRFHLTKGEVAMTEAGAFLFLLYLSGKIYRESWSRCRISLVTLTESQLTYMIESRSEEVRAWFENIITSEVLRQKRRFRMDPPHLTLSWSY